MRTDGITKIGLFLIDGGSMLRKDNINGSI